VYELYIGNKNYSSWSLRTWAVMSELGIPFTEHLVKFGDAAAWARFRRLSPSGKVPCLIDAGTRVWDTLAIAEYLAERHAGIWPADAQARAFARCAAAEMHSGFSELRSRCSMSCGLRVRLHEVGSALETDLERLGGLWGEGLKRFGGPFLAGAKFTAADAFFAPVAFRVQSYGLALDADSAAYVARLLALQSMQRWYAAALKETFRDEPHEAWVPTLGTVLEDLRDA